MSSLDEAALSEAGVAIDVRARGDQRRVVVEHPIALVRHEC